MSGEPYGAKGCSCWPNEDYNPWDDRTTAFLPNSGCRFHGVLAEFTPPRTDTGVYKVIDLPGVDLTKAHREDRGCDESVTFVSPELFDELKDDRIEGPGGWSMDATEHVVVSYDDTPPPWPDYVYRQDRPMTDEEAKAVSDAMRDPNAPTRKLPPRWDRWGEHHDVTPVPDEGKDGRGIFAAVRRWGRRTAQFVSETFGNYTGWL